MPTKSGQCTVSGRVRDWRNSQSVDETREAVCFGLLSGRMRVALLKSYTKGLSSRLNYVILTVHPIASELVHYYNNMTMTPAPR
jgi:hypothetical protein